MAEPLYTFFIAHAGRDKPRAEELYDLLIPDVPCFLDARDLVYGDNWTVELPRAQHASRATVALVSAVFEAAYYLGEEIASAIAYQRADPDSHRLIPVYLDGVPSDPRMIPYGMRVRHALDAARIGMADVASELRKTAALLVKAPPPPEAPPQPPRDAETPSRTALYDTLCKLLPSQFDEVVFRAGAPKEHLAPPAARLAQRALDLVQWGEQAGFPRIKALHEGIQKVAPGIAP